MCGEAFGSVVKIRRVFVLGEPRCVEHLGKLGSFLRGVVVFRSRVVFGRNGVEVQRFKKLPFFIRRHERVLHELVEGFKALYIYSHGIFIALFGPIERVLVGVTDSAQVAYGRLIFDIRCILPISFLASFYAI